MPVVDPVTFQSSLPGVFFGGDSAMGPKNIIWAVEHGHQAAISIHNHCEAVPVSVAAHPRDSNLVSQKMGLTGVELSQRLQPIGAPADAARRADPALPEHRTEVEVGFSAEQTARRGERCLNCDIQTVFQAPLCIGAHACIDICPVQVPDDHREW